MADPGRRKVGPAPDAEVAKRLKQYDKEVADTNARQKAAPAAQAPAAAQHSPEELNVATALHALLQKHPPAEGGPGGKVRERKIDEVVDQAVNDANKAPMDY